MKMGVVEVPALDRFIDPDIVSTPEKASGFPVKIN
jgi:hypothetical protein